LAAWRRDRLDAGDLLSVSVEGWRHPVFALAEDLPLLRDLAAGRVPAAWQPLEADTYQEAVFLSPLDVVSARGRAKQLFDFDYVWEVYKPLEQRRWGYYTLPILWGDRLVGRFDGKLDRPANTLRILGFWLEDPATGKDPDFAAALGRGMARYLRFLGAARLDAAAIRPVALRRAVVGACRG
ncbi:MAG: DNA glycosylase AlkZ-like family protein, partial [Anaerolineae bacterium]